MREIIKSIISLSMAVPLFGVQQLSNMISRKEDKQPTDHTGSTLDSVTQVAQEQMGDTMRSLYKGGDTIQRSVIDMIFSAVSRKAEQAENSQPPTSGKSQAAAVNRGKLDTSTVVMLGEGLAAGMGDFGLSEEFQETSFPALITQQMGTEFNQPLMQSPGIGDLVGFPTLPVRIPAIMQTTALKDFPPSMPLHNLSVPGFKVADALNLRPIAPLVHRDDTKQSLANLVLGMPDLMHQGDQPLMTQLEYALKWKPTFTLIELGYHEVMEAAVAFDLKALPDLKTFREHYRRILTELREAGSEVLVMTIPDPADTAFFSPIESAAQILKVKPEALRSAYQLEYTDRITVNGLMDIGCQIIAGEIKSLTHGVVIDGAWMEQVSNHVAALNDEITLLSREHGALVYDLHGFYRRVREIGVSLGSRRISADFLGGFYELNGYYPGPTGHALLANDILQLLNNAYGAEFPIVDVGRILATDPVADYRQPEGPVLAEENLATILDSVGTLDPASDAPTVDDVESEAVDTSGDGHASGLALEEFKPGLPLTLPTSLEQALTLNKEASYYGDAIRAVHCRDDEEAKFGSGRELLFGGLAMVDSHLRGTIRIKFSKPVDEVTHFEVMHEDGLVGDDGVLAAPQFFKLPARHNSVKDDPDLVSSGDLNLKTGEVTDLQFYFRFMNTALLSLVRANPKFPDVPISFISNPPDPTKSYGSAWARFEQRADGNLDFTFYGTTFVPLGSALPDPVRFPLPFCSPTLQFASIPAAGTQLHPHIHLSTKAPEPVGADNLPEIPTNTIREYTVYARNTSFGDKFTLNVPELGGEATGRSQLMGRVEIQFGEQFGDSVSIAVACFAPGGMLYDPNPPPSLLTETFPGRLYSGLHGHNEILRFPEQTYGLNDVYCLDDPFDLSVGAVNVKTGRLLTELLHRGLIGQDLFFALLEVEPRTPRESFNFRGPALFEKDSRGQTVFRFRGQVTVLYPEGFLFPKPDQKTGFVVGPGSVLDPFLWVRAIDAPNTSPFVKKGGRDNVKASTGDQFSYHFEISNESGGNASFTYVNHTQDATYTMHRLAWVSFENSETSTLKSGHYDTVTFTGFGSWSKDDEPTPRLVTAQISTSRETPYVSIQIDGGFISNVNTKPPDLEDVRP